MMLNDIAIARAEREERIRIGEGEMPVR